MVFDLAKQQEFYKELEDGKLVVPEDIQKLLTEKLDTLESYRISNLRKSKYYEGKKRVENLNIALPENYINEKTAIGWAGTAVDVLHERINLDGFSVPEGIDISDIYTQNQLDVQSDLCHLDSLIYGISYAIIGSGDPDFGEPKTLITFESPNEVIGKYNRKSRSLDYAIHYLFDEEDEVEGAVVYLKNETINVSTNGSMWSIDPDGVDSHNLGVVPVVRMVNRLRSADTFGRSEITRPIQYLVDFGLRTMAAIEVNRELYAFPRAALLGVDPKTFQTQDGLPNWDGLSTYMSALWAMPNDADGNPPTLTQMSANSPGVYTELVKMLKEELASETGIPASYLGQTSANPASAEALKSAETRLVKRAQDRQKSFGIAWRQIIQIALLVRDGVLPEGYEKIEALWKDASSPTKAQDADAAVKYTQGDNPILPSDSEVVYEMINLTERQKQILRDEKKAKQTSGLIDAIKANAANIRATNEVAAVASSQNNEN